jgi:hypothetical protein
MLLVFDFHHTLSLQSGKVNPDYLKTFYEQLENGMLPDIHIGINDLKTLLKKYKGINDSWYQSMKNSKLDAKIMMPTIDDIISFVDYIPKNYVFAVASMLEDEQFMYDLLRYCFEQKGRLSPFTTKTIVSIYGLKETDVKSKGMNDKWPHIEVILKRNNFHFEKDQIVMIDDDLDNIKYISSIGVCGIHVNEYFTIEEWNKGCYSS